MAPSPLIATQTAPAPVAIALGLLPTPSGLVALTAASFGSMRVTLGAFPFSTQTAPSPTAMAIGAGSDTPDRPVIGMRARIEPVRGVSALLWVTTPSDRNDAREAAPQDTTLAAVA